MSINDERIDIELLQHHLLWLRTNGVTSARIADLVNRAPSHIKRLANGEHGRISYPLYEAILRIRPTDADDGSYVNSRLTWRRVRSLQAVGWPANWIGEQLGMPNGVRIGKPNTTVALARAVATLVREFGMTLGPSDRARKYALRKGWKPHAYYDDNLIEFVDG